MLSLRYLNWAGMHLNWARTNLRTKEKKITCCAWAGGTYANYPDFCKNHQFHVIYCVNLAYVLYFEEFLTLDSCWFTIFKEWLTKSVVLVPLSAKYLICRHVRTDWRTDWWSDWQTDELFLVGLGNLGFLLDYLLTMTRILEQRRNISESFIIVRENILKSDLIYLLRQDQRCYVYVFMFFLNWPGDLKHLVSARWQADKYIAHGGKFFMFFTWRNCWLPSPTRINLEEPWFPSPTTSQTQIWLILNKMTKLKNWTWALLTKLQVYASLSGCLTT